MSIIFTIRSQEKFLFPVFCSSTSDERIHMTDEAFIFSSSLEIMGIRTESKYEIIFFSCQCNSPYPILRSISIYLYRIDSLFHESADSSTEFFDTSESFMWMCHWYYCIVCIQFLCNRNECWLIWWKLFWKWDDFCIFPFSLESFLVDIVFSDSTISQSMKKFHIRRKFCNQCDKMRIVESVSTSLWKTWLDSEKRKRNIAKRSANHETHFSEMITLCLDFVDFSLANSRENSIYFLRETTSIHRDMKRFLIITISMSDRNFYSFNSINIWYFLKIPTIFRIAFSNNRQYLTIHNIMICTSNQWHLMFEYFLCYLTWCILPVRKRSMEMKINHRKKWRYLYHMDFMNGFWLSSYMWIKRISYF